MISAFDFWSKEITLIEQTILFCKNLVQTKSEDKKAGARCQAAMLNCSGVFVIA